MAQETDMERALEVYHGIINHLDEMGWIYERQDDDLVIKTGVRGEGMLVEFLIAIDEKNRLIQFFSQAPFDFPEERRTDGAIAVCHVNCKLTDGSFDYNFNNGSLMYRMSCSYRGNNLGNDLIDYVMYTGVSAVDEYNYKFYMLSTGQIDLMKFLKSTNGD